MNTIFIARRGFAKFTETAKAAHAAVAPARSAPVKDVARAPAPSTHVKQELKVWTFFFVHFFSFGVWILCFVGDTIAQWFAGGVGGCWPAAGPCQCGRQGRIALWAQWAARTEPCFA